MIIYHVKSTGHLKHTAAKYQRSSELALVLHATVETRATYMQASVVTKDVAQRQHSPSEKDSVRRLSALSGVDAPRLTREEGSPFLQTSNSVMQLSTLGLRVLTVQDGPQALAMVECYSFDMPQDLNLHVRRIGDKVTSKNTTQNTVVQANKRRMQTNT